MGASVALVFVATRAGIPISSSHAMIGGLLGTGIAVGGFSAIILPGIIAVAAVLLFGCAGAILGAVVLGVFMLSFHENPGSAPCGERSAAQR